jgi:hypothetical protein
MKRTGRISLALSPALLLAACGGGGPASGSSDAGSIAAPAVQAAVVSVPTWVAPASLGTFDFSGWKLTLPVDAYGGTGGTNGTQYPAQTLLPQQLVGGYASAWFHADDQGRTVFDAPANGAVTTPGVGSDHTRSELREDYTGPGATTNGDWTGAGTLAASCAVHQVASASKSAIIGQLRSDGHDFALVMYRSATRDVAVDVYATNLSGSTHAATVLATNVDVDQAIAYSLSFDRSVLTATINGATRSFPADASWVGAPLYFKVGAYHLAPNTGNPPDDATVVACSRFAVTH